MTHEYRTTRRIEFADTDMAGIVHFSRFYVFMEQAEHEFWRSLGLSVRMELEGNLISWPRLGASCEFLAPVRFEEMLDIRLSVRRKGEKSVTYGCTFSKGGELVARGELTAACCVCNPGEPMKAIEIPGVIADKIEESRESS